MRVISEIGKAVLTGVRIEWKIKDFFSLSEIVGDCYRSSYFTFGDEEWCLSLFPNGDSISSSGWVGVFLNRKAFNPPTTVHIFLTLIHSDGAERKGVLLETEFSKECMVFGISQFCSRTELRDGKSILKPNNELTVICALSNVAFTFNSFIAKKKVINSLISMLENGDDSDVVIKVQGKEFPAHKAILRARSPVFKSMFTHFMVEKQSNVVNIEDGDPDTFPDFLAHIYSGSCDQISAQNVYSLYTAAEKYDFGELKYACANFMKMNITVSCFCAVMTIALKHDDKGLIECAKNFFCNNTADIAKTVEWQIFLKESVTVGNELFIEAVSK